jgi:redox-regulated HSP33 family molecular chaperone
MISINRQNRVGKKGKMLRRQLLRDVVLRAHVGNLRVSAVIARKTIAEGARRWDLPTTAVASQLWSEYMVGTVMLSSFFKGEERVKMTVRAPTNEEIYVEALAVGEVRLSMSSYRERMMQIADDVCCAH